MKQKIETLEYTLPDYLACYLINGDEDGITDNEKAEIDAFLANEGIKIVEVKDDSSFRWCNDLNSNQGANCSTYIAHKIK